MPAAIRSTRHMVQIFPRYSNWSRRTGHPEKGSLLSNPLLPGGILLSDICQSVPGEVPALAYCTGPSRPSRTPSSVFPGQLVHLPSRASCSVREVPGLFLLQHGGSTLPLLQELNVWLWEEGREKQSFMPVEKPEKFLPGFHLETPC